MNSAIYEGVVTHRRVGPPQHNFQYRIALPLLDLAEVADVCAKHPLWSARRPNAVWFRRKDFYGPSDQPLAESITELVEQRLGWRPQGPILMLGHVRTWGWLFNPITCYWCLDPVTSGTSAFVAHVTNTPWNERYAYVADGLQGEEWFDKSLHVSPFMPMNQRYRITFSTPGRVLRVGIASVQDGTEVFAAAISARRQELSRAALGRVLWRYPLMTLRVSGGIYAQAARLKRKGATFYPHPESP